MTCRFRKNVYVRPLGGLEVGSFLGPLGAVDFQPGVERAARAPRVVARKNSFPSDPSFFHRNGVLFYE